MEPPITLSTSDSAMELLIPLSPRCSSMGEVVERDRTGDKEEVDKIKFTVEIFLNSWNSLSFTLRVKPCCTVECLKSKVSRGIFRCQNFRMNYDVYRDAFVRGKQVLQDGLTLADCNISNLDRISVLPCRPFKIDVACTIGPERLPIYEPFEVNSLESVGSLKNKIFNCTNLPAERQLLCCGDRWLSSVDDETRLLDLGIVRQFSSDHKLIDMPCLQVTAYRHISLRNQEFQLSVKVPESKYQFSLTVHPADTINHVKSMILPYSTFHDDTHMLIFEDKNLLEVGDSALLDHGIEKEVQLVLCQKGSFLIWVSRKGSDQRFTVEVESLDTVNVLKEKINKLTNIAPENQILFFEGDKGPVVMYEGCLVRYGIVKLIDRNVPEHLISYSDDDERMKLYLSRKYRNKEVSVPRIPLSFWKMISDFASAGVPMEDFLKQIKSQTNIEASLKIYVLVPLNYCLTFQMMFTSEVGDTLDILRNKIKERAMVCKEIDDLTYIHQGDYVLIHNKQKLLEDGSLTLEQCGICHWSEIILCPRASFTIKVGIQSSIYMLKDVEITIVVNCWDTVSCVKEKIIAHSGFHVRSMKLSYKKTTLSGENHIVDYGIVSHPVASERRWKYCEVKLQAILDEGSTWHDQQYGFPHLKLNKTGKRGFQAAFGENSEEKSMGPYQRGSEQGSINGNLSMERSTSASVRFCSMLTSQIL